MIRALVLLVFVVLTLVFVVPMPDAAARPPFARREGKACGYCHINPRGGGPRNQRGLEYARNEFKFPVTGTNLNAFAKDRDRAEMVEARKMIGIDHVKAAVATLRKLAKKQKDGTPAAALVTKELHALEVKGTEMLGQARRLLRGQTPEEGIELLCVIVSQFKGLEIYEDAATDLKEARANKAWKPLIKAEQREAKARLVYLDAERFKALGDADKARKGFAKVVKSYPGTRVAELAAAELPKDEE